MATKLFSDLLPECKTLMRNAGYSQRTRLTYESIWVNKLKPFMDAKGMSDYSVQLGEEFLSSIPEDLTVSFNRTRRCVTILNTVLETGQIKRYIPQAAKLDFKGEIGKLFQELLEYKISKRASRNTINVYERILVRLQSFLHINGIDKVSDIQEKHLLDFVNSSQINPSHRVLVVRGLCKYLVETGMVSPHYGMLVKGYRFPIREKLPSVFSEDEIKAIGNAINRKQLGGKRMYAAFLLASRLGLRRSDIVNLKFENIDWDNNRISIIQQKTRRKVDLPLVPEIGNALIDYLKNERVTGKSNYVFLTLKPPYQKISVDVLYRDLQKAIGKSKINVDKRRHGMHTMRHSLASQLLANDMSLPVISSILGHSSSSSTSNYLKVDIDGLKKMLLEVPLVPESFYTQNGGHFYE